MEPHVLRSLTDAELIVIARRLQALGDYATDSAVIMRRLLHLVGEMADRLDGQDPHRNSMPGSKRAQIGEPR